MKKLIVFTDLDGTLLDHENYSYQAARPAIELLKERHYPLIINSSKTYAEIREFINELNIIAPFVVENGSAIVLPPAQLGNTSDQEQVVQCGEAYKNIIENLAQLRAQHGYRFSGFNDMSTETLMALTNLGAKAAEKARQRQASEPLTWNGDESSFQQFRRDVENLNYQIIKGGRFYHVMGICNKGTAVKWLLEHYQESEPQTKWHSVALGDSQNDIPMLESVDTPVLIKNIKSNQAMLNLPEKTLVSERSGPEGWHTIITELIKNF